MSWTFRKRLLYGLSVGVGVPAIALLATAAFPGFAPHDSRAFKNLTLGQSYLATLQTGDLVFFNQPAFIPFPLKMILSGLAKSANNDDFEHVGVIYWHPTENYPYIVEKTWRGLQFTNFEDRVLHSGAQDIMIRSMHFMRTPEQELQAARFLDQEASTSGYDPLARAASWLYQMYALSRISIANMTAPRGSPPLKRAMSMQEIAEMMGKEGDFSEIGVAVEDEGIFSTFTTTGTSNGPTHAITRVSLFGEVFHTARMLQQTEKRLQTCVNKQAEMLSATNAKVASNSSTGTGTGTGGWWSWAFGAKKASDGLTPEQRKKEAAEELLLLLRRRQFLSQRLSSLYDDYRTMSLKYIERSVLEPIHEGSAAALPNTEFVVKFLSAVGVGMPCHDGYGYGSAAELKERLPENLPRPKIAENPDSQPVLINGEDVSSVLHPSYDYHAIQQILEQCPPRAREYFPHDFREGSFLKLKRGILGEEQHIVQRFNRPPWEVTDNHVED